MKRRWIYFAIIFLILVTVFGTLYFRRDRRFEPIRTTGIVEAIEVNISTKASGKISYICCEEGDKIEKGNIAIRLEANDLKASVKEALAGVEKANAEVGEAEAAIESAKANIASAEADIKSAAADLEKSRVQMEDAKKQLNRAKTLYVEKTVSEEEFDTAVTDYESANADYASSKAGLTSACAKKDVAIAQLRTAKSQLNSALANLEELKAKLLFNRAKFAETRVTSPISGTVVFKAFEKGEMVTSGTTILTIVDMDDLYIRVDIEETLVGYITLNSRAFITVEGAPGRIFQGNISEIGRYAEFATQRDVLRGRQDIKTFRVKINADDPTGFLKPGMTVEVEIPKMIIKEQEIK